MLSVLSSVIRLTVSQAFRGSTLHTTTLNLRVSNRQPSHHCACATSVPCCFAVSCIHGDRWYQAANGHHKNKTIRRIRFWKTDLSAFLTPCCTYLNILPKNMRRCTQRALVSLVTVSQAVLCFLSYSRILWQFVGSVWGPNQQPSNTRFK